MRKTKSITPDFNFILKRRCVFSLYEVNYYIKNSPVYEIKFHIFTFYYIRLFALGKRIYEVNLKS